MLHHFILSQQLYRHPKEDLVILHLHNEEEFERVLDQAGMPFVPLELSDESSPALGDVRTDPLLFDFAFFRV